MKRLTLFAVVLSAAMLLASAAFGEQAPGWGNRYCPNCGAYQGPGGYGMGPGPGMMGYGMGQGTGMMGYGMGQGTGMMGYGMGPGMMGYGMGPGMMGYGMGAPMHTPYGQQYKTPLDEKDSRRLVENYLASWGNPNLKLGKVEDKGPSFEVEIVTKDNSLVEKVQIDKNSGWLTPVR